MFGFPFKTLFLHSYQILCECIDKIVMKSVQLRLSLDLPEKEFLLVKSEGKHQEYGIVSRFFCVYRLLLL